MKVFLPALLIGMLLGAGLMLAVPRDTAPRPVAPGSPATEDSPDRTVTEMPNPRSFADRPSAAASGTVPATFAPGTAVLRIGDSFVFGEDHVTRGAKDDEVDVLCLDLRDSATLLGSSGAAAALLPPARAEGSPSPRAAYALLADAPEEFGGETVELRRNAADDQSGVALIRAQDGLCYKVVAVKFVDDRHALRRSVQVEYARVPQVAGGGIVPVPGGLGSSRVDPETAARLKPLFRAPREIKPSRGTSGPQGTFVRIGEIPEDFEITQRATFLLPRTLRTKLSLGIFTGVYAEQGIARGAEVKAGTFSAVVVEGEMAGKIDGDGAFIHVLGNLTGTLIADNCTVIVDGDLLGTIELSGIPQVLIRGTVRDPTTALRGKGIPRIFIGGYTTRNQVMSFQRQQGIWSLDLAESDIPEGEHRRISFWSEVTVGGGIWEKLRR